MDHSLSQGAQTHRLTPSSSTSPQATWCLQPYRPPPRQGPAASPYSPCGPPCPVAGSGANHMSREFWVFRGKAGSGPEASCPPEKLLRVSLQE